jgi:TorA maturation chaperone TorD
MPASVTDIAGVESFAGKTTERSHLYGFLAAIYRAEPTTDLLQQIKSPPFLQALDDVGVTLDKDFLDLPAEQLLSELALEYTRLFVGPGKHISPHGSVYMSGEGGSLWGVSTAAAKRFIESVGAEFRPEYHGLPDHISVELEFMQQLTRAEAQAYQRHDQAAAAQFLSIEKEFIQKHLATWVPAFCDRVIGEADSSFYREMAKLTRNFVLADKEEVEKLT